MVLSGADEYTDRVRELGCEVREVAFHPGGVHVLKDIATLLRCAFAFGVTRPDYILNFTPKANIFSTLAAFGVEATVVNNISGLGRAFSDGQVSLVGRVSTLLYRLVAARVSYVFYQNARDMAFGLEFGFSSPERSGRLPGSGVDLTRFAHRPREKTTPFRFVHVARLLPQKGVFDFLAAARNLRSSFGPEMVEFQVVGPDGGLSQQERLRFKGECRNAGVTYLGMVDNVEDVLQEAHCAVLPSVYAEGVPRSLIEASASGTFVICYPNPGSEEIVRHGINGLVTEAAVVNQLVVAMTEVLTMDAKEYRAYCVRGIELARREFDESQVVEAYHRVLGIGA